MKDESVKQQLHNVKGNRENPNHISATMPGTVIKVVVKEGDEVKRRFYRNYRSDENGNDSSSAVQW